MRALRVVVAELVGVAVEDVDVGLGGRRQQPRRSTPSSLPALIRSMAGVPCSRAACAVLAASRLATNALLPRASFSNRGIAFSSVCRSASASSVRDRLDVRGRVDLAVDVRDVVVAEHARHLADRRRLADVGEELVAETLALEDAADDARDVHELHGGRYDAGPTDDRRHRRRAGDRAEGPRPRTSSAYVAPPPTPTGWPSPGWTG